MTEQEQMQERWNHLEEKRRKLGFKIDLAYERGIYDGFVEQYEQEYEEVTDEQALVEDWLVDHNAPGWVAT